MIGMRFERTLSKCTFDLERIRLRTHAQHGPRTSGKLFARTYFGNSSFTARRSNQLGWGKWQQTTHRTDARPSPIGLDLDEMFAGNSFGLLSCRFTSFGTTIRRIGCAKRMMARR